MARKLPSLPDNVQQSDLRIVRVISGIAGEMLRGVQKRNLIA